MTHATAVRAKAISALVTHRDPDIDDVEAIRLMRQHGNSMFPGARVARIIATGERTTFEGMEDVGFLCIGVGGGIFDEHPYEGRPRREGESAATLVAKYLGLEIGFTTEYALLKNYSAQTDEWEIAPLVKLAFRYGTHTGNDEQDRQATEKIFDVAFLFLDIVERNEKWRADGRKPEGRATLSMHDIIHTWIMRRGIPKDAKAVELLLQYAGKYRQADVGDFSDFRLANLVCLAQKHLCVGREQELRRTEIVQATEILLDAVLRQAENFHVKCKADWEAASTTVVARFAKGNVVSVLSDNPEIAKYGRSKHGGRAAVIIKRESTGNTQVFFDQSRGLDVAPVIAALRQAEREAKGIRTPLPKDELEKEGSAVYGAEEWYYDGHQILNGSLTTTVRPTALSRQRIEEIVAKTLRRQMS